MAYIDSNIELPELLLDVRSERVLVRFLDRDEDVQICRLEQRLNGDYRWIVTHGRGEISYSIVNTEWLYIPK